ncbi:MAG TPA: amidohydrolase family protein [Acidimicrobiales bacterium]|nr:amidohydrolase family protein [Acidimicrobiales bacterium]
MEIIDCQVHVWDTGARDRLPEDFPRQDLLRLFDDQVTYEVQLAAMDTVGVSATVLNVPGVIYRRRRPDGFLEYDNSYADEAAARYPDRFYSVAWADAAAPDIEDVLDVLQASPGVVGIRQHVGPHDGLAELTDGSWDRFLAGAGRRGLTVFIVMTGALDALHAAVRRHPETRFVIDHFGLPVPQVRPAESGGPFDQLPSVLALAQHPNVAIKWSGAQRLSKEPYPYLDIWPHLLKVVEAFGVDRLMFASDWTVSRSLCSYAEAVFYLRDTSHLSETEKREILSGTARRWLHLTQLEH